MLNSNICCCTATYHPSRKVRRTRHAGHCWRSRDELISDVLLWTPSYGRAKAGWPARTYIQQLSEDTGCSLEDLRGATSDWEGWREMVRDICADGTTRWWWFETIWLCAKQRSAGSFENNVMYKLFAYKSCIAPSAAAAEYTDCISTEGQDPPPTSVRDMTLWEMLSTPSLPLFSDPLRPGVVVPIYWSNRTKLCTCV